MKKAMEYPENESVWIHHKCGLYQVICVARNTETGVDEVIYKKLLDDMKDKPEIQIFARPVNMWNDIVQDEFGKYPIRRFSKVNSI